MIICSHVQKHRSNIGRSSSINCKYRIGDIVAIIGAHSFTVTHIRINIGDGKVTKQYSYKRKVWYLERELIKYE